MTPEVPQFTPGWQLGEPDLVVRMDQPFEIPEDGPDLFRNFAIPLDLDQEQWVRAVEFRPSGKASHHALFFLDPTGQAVQSDAADPAPGFDGMNFLGTGGGVAGGRGRGGLFRKPSGRCRGERRQQGVRFWRLGSRREPRRPATGYRTSASGRLRPCASDALSSDRQTGDRAGRGWDLFRGRAAGTHTSWPAVAPLAGALAGIDIPAGTQRFVISDSFTLPIDVEIVGGGAHAHYLSTDMRMTATLPDGTVRVILGIPDWDFNWQERYYFEEPVLLPEGTRLDVEIAYDNTRDNPNNPFDPPQRVTFGRESIDEMGSMTLEMIAVRERDLPRYVAAVREHLQNAVITRRSNPGRRRLQSR